MCFDDAKHNMCLFSKENTSVVCKYRVDNLGIWDFVFSYKVDEYRSTINNSIGLETPKCVAMVNIDGFFVYLFPSAGIISQPNATQHRVEECDARVVLILLVCAGGPSPGFSHVMGLPRYRLTV